MTRGLVTIEFWCPECGECYTLDFEPADAEEVLREIEAEDSNERTCDTCAEETE